MLYPLAAEEPRHIAAGKLGDPKAALAMAHLEAETSLSARRMLAQAYASGSGVTLDFTIAAVHAKVCAEAADHACEFIYGKLLADGKGVSRNDREALVWLKKALDSGIIEAKAEISKVKVRMNPVGP